MKDDELKLTVAGDLDQESRWQVASDAPESRISCGGNLVVDDLIEIGDCKGCGAGLEMTHESEDGRYHAAVTDATEKLFIRIE